MKSTDGMREEYNKMILSLRIKYKALNKKERLKLITKIILYIIWIVIFILQLIQLINEYKSGRTVVNIKVEKIKYNKLPAITICYPEFISMEKMAKLSPELNTSYTEYENIIKNVRDNDFENYTLLNTLNNIYWNNFTKIGKQYEIPIYDMFEKLSLPFRVPKRPIYQFKVNGSEYSGLYDWNDTEYSIEIEAKGTIVNNSNIENVVISDLNPIESIYKDYKEEGKCYTFFSDLNPKWREIIIDLESIEIHIHHDINWFPPSVYDNHYKPIHFAMHSSNSIPDLSISDTYIPLTPGHSHTITFSSTKTILLPPNYSTNCRNYDLNDKNSEKLRTDCINKCVNKKFQTKCNQKSCIYPTAALFRKYVYIDYKSDKYCILLEKNGSYGEIYFCIRKNMGIIKSICEDKCEKECTKQFYDFEIKANNRLQLSPWDGKTFVDIKHNRLPDQVIEHLPEMTFITFVGNIGGLAGMWLGLSALAIFDFIIKYF